MNSQVQILKWMLQDVRAETFQGIEGLTKEKLFQPPIPGEAPIGAYLMHLGEVDAFWYSQLSGNQMPEEVTKRVYDNCWFDCPPENYNPPKEIIEVQEYWDAITATRNIVLEYLDNMKDAELEQNIILKRKSGDTLISKKWIIYHLIEHECHHRGQMFMLIRMGKLRQ